MKSFAYVVCLAALLIASALQAAATPGFSSAASSLRPEDLRVAAIAYRLGRSGLSYCPNHFPLTGLLLHHLPEYDGAGRQEMKRTYHLDRGPGVLAVVAASPAARAGLIAGDVLLTVNGQTFPSPTEMAAMRDREEWRSAIDRSETMLDQALRDGPVRLLVLRNGSEVPVELDSVPGCPAKIRLARSRQTNAFANGHSVVVTTALLDFVRSDDELAIVIGHELAHNILGHPAQLDAQGVPHGILRGFGKNASRVRFTEEEADRLGLRLAWSAGFRTGAAIPFWRRYYAAFDRSPQLFRTHPSLHAREKLITETLAKLRTDAGGAK